MKKVKLTRMSLHNFKGIKSFETTFNDRTQIFGDNATGKTTLADAFTWLLFGKDTTGRKDFAIKTYDSRNNVIHKLDHEVTGTFDVDGEEIILRRVFKEKWVTRRGSQDAELQGHETLFFWNDVPLQAGEYQLKVDGIIAENTFRMITSPMYFNSLKWQERREILISIAGNVSDAAIAASKPDFSILFDNMGKKSIDEFKKELVAKKKNLKKEMEEIPARIDEVERNTPEEKDWIVMETEIKVLESEIKSIDEQLLDASKMNEDFLKQKRERQEKIHRLKTQISDMEFDGRKTFSQAMQEKTEAISTAKAEIERINRKIKNDVAEAEELQQKIKNYEDRQSKLRDEWIKINAHEFPGFGNNEDFLCPTCKQNLPESEVELKKNTMLSNFNYHKEKQLADISGQGRALNPIIDNLKQQVKALKKFDYDAQVAVQETIIKTWENKPLVSVQAILSENAMYNKTLQELDNLINEPETEFPETDNSALKSKKADLQQKADLLKKELATKEQIESSGKRREELLRREKEYARQLAELEQTEFTIQEFTRAKVDMLESKINSMFDGVKFRLFDIQLNGGLVECCDTLIDGVPWTDANNAAKINAGIAIINVLSAHYRQTAPIWIDNSESITRIKKSNAQVIELYVSETHKNLEVKVA